MTLFGNGAEGIVDLLVVSRGSQIFANGSSVAPIIVTSRNDLLVGAVGVDPGAVTPGTEGDPAPELRSVATGEIGGIAINGRAPLNECTVDSTAEPGSAACEQSGEGGSGNFGGATTDDNSGLLNFVQIRFAGFLFNEGEGRAQRPRSARRR